MSSTWIMSVSGRTYGPYTAEQMQNFAVEGRLAAYSLVARSEDGQFGPASQDTDLSFLFKPPATVDRMQKDSDLANEAPRPFGQGEVAVHDEPAHFLIVADMKSGSISVLEEEIYRIGPAYSIMPQAWVLSSELAIGTLRNILIQKLGKLDVIVVVDATHDKISWCNLGIETETRVRRVWTKPRQQLSAA
jgi:hypothetical protein